MSATAMGDSIGLTHGPDNGSGSLTGPNEVVSVQCECCGLSEECTLSYIQTIRERYGGKWICGLCGEAIKDEILRRDQSFDEALTRHSSFCSKFRVSSPPEDPTGHLIRVMKRALTRSLDSPKLIRSAPSSPIGKRAKGDEKIDFKGKDLLWC